MNDVKNISKYIDHTLLKQDASESAIRKLCEEAVKYDFASVCVNSCYVPLCYTLLKDSDVKVCTVVGFPLGAMSTAAKAYEAKDAVDNGAEEIDMVINVGEIKSGNWEYVEQDIARVVNAVKDKAIVKVIIETCLLTDEEKERACIISKNAGAQYVKTSTGFSTGGAKPEDIALMRKTVGAEMGVKASGGIHSLEEAMAMINAGATRIGASAGVQIVAEAEAPCACGASRP